MQQNYLDSIKILFLKNTKKNLAYFDLFPGTMVKSTVKYGYLMVNEFQNYGQKCPNITFVFCNFDV